MNQEFFRAALELESTHTPFVVVTLVRVDGSAPQNPGAKAIVSENGLYAGTVGGGKVEARAISHAQLLLNSRPHQPDLVTWNLQLDIGMTCGGQALFLFEIHDPKKWEIAVFGAGHVAQALVRTLSSLDCHITNIDSRPEWLEKMPAASNLSRICDQQPERRIHQLNEKTFFVVMTQGHATDVPILDAVFREFPNMPYVGVMGSDIKAQKIRKELMGRGHAESLVERLRCPIGIRAGSNAPSEIAISVASELLQARDWWREVIVDRVVDPAGQSN